MKYAFIANVPYLKPNTPVRPQNVVGLTQHQITSQRDLYLEQLREYREVTAVENALRQQLVTAVEPMFLAALRDHTTNKIIAPVYNILQHLYETYGKITSDEVEQETMNLHQFVYDPQLPIDSVFTLCDEFADYMTAAKVPITQKQMIRHAYVIIKKTGLFNDELKSWNRRQPLQQTWVNFKLALRVAYQELEEMHDLTQSNTQFGANMVQEIVEGLRDELTAIQPEQPLPTQLYGNQVTPSTSIVSSDVSTLMDEVASLKAIINQIQFAMNAVQQRPPSPLSYNHPYYPPSVIGVTPGTMAPSQLTPPFQQPPLTAPAPPLAPTTRRKPKKKRQYCWTHGLCYHQGTQCREKATGHQDAATLQNRMGGSARNTGPNE